MHPKQIIKFSNVSRFLAGTRSVVTYNRCPEAHRPAMEELINLVEKWQEKYQPKSKNYEKVNPHLPPDTDLQ